MYDLLLPAFTAFMMGLFGGAHCLGMCGGIVCALSYANPNEQAVQTNTLNYHLSYSLGRIITYTLLGAVTGLLGLVVSYQLSSTGGLLLRYFAAIFVILVGLYIAQWWQVISSLEKVGQKLWRYISPLTRYLLPIKNMRQAFFLGSLWGLLPCGMVYSALIYSLSTGNWLNGASVMFFFGLGTLPALLLAGTAMQKYHRFIQQRRIKQFSGLIMIIFGLVSIAYLLHHQNLAMAAGHTH